MLYELRINEQGKRWEEIKPIRVKTGTVPIQLIAAAIAGGEGVEVRYNQVGSGQGHYMLGNDGEYIGRGK